MKILNQTKKGNGKPKKKVEVKLKLNLWKIVLATMIFIIVAPMFLSAAQTQINDDQVELSNALADIKKERVEKVEIQDDKVILTYKDDSIKVTIKETGQNFTELLTQSGIDPSEVNYTVVDQSLTKAFSEAIGIILPLAIMLVFFFLIFRSQSKGAQDVFSFGRSKAKLFAKGKQDITFKDVAGVDYAKNELVELVDFLKKPAKYRKIGARTPRGALLVGPAGVGKTLLAKAVAGEANVPFFSMAGSEFMEMLVGIGASVTGDTPVLVKQKGKTKLLPISEIVDSYYKERKSVGAIKVSGLETLGLNPEVNGFWGTHSSKRPVFGGSKWQEVEAVYRHKVNGIYEVNFLGGQIRTTGDHSVFIREHGGIRSKEVSKLKKGDVLVNLPMNTRAWDYKNKKTDHQIKKHTFPHKGKSIYLDVWQDDTQQMAKFQYTMAHEGEMYQHQIAEQIGVSQATVGNWQRGVYDPAGFSKKLVKLKLPEKAIVTPQLMKLFGYYTAEGRGTNSLEFTFGSKEKRYIEEIAELMTETFGIGAPKLYATDTNSVKVIYYSAHLGRFFTKYCGNGSHNKHIPPFLWDMPRDFFLAYLKGYSNGDGYITKSGKLSMTSVSHRLIRELSWLCNMHGIKLGVKHEIQKAGRSVLNGKPLPETESWTIIIGKTNNPFGEEKKKAGHFKRAIVRSVKKRPYNGYVYDLCGVEKEAFFGGETPILLHNSRVRSLFQDAKKAAPSIIFIDEIDAIGRQRGRSGMMGGHDEREQTLNQILVEMDGFTPNDNVIIIAATNRGDLLDPALLRPGRFDRRVVLDMPDKEGREAILKIHARTKKFKKINWAKVADKTVGFSGADIENMLNEAAIQAAKADKTQIALSDIDEAATKVKLGPAKKRLQSAEDKKITAYHEAGHAIVTHFLLKTDPVERISIVARGMSLGHTLIPPAADRVHETRSRMLATIAAMLGGRAAEELVFSEMTSGASNDIEQATRLARAMVIDFGMSPLGPINFGPQFDYDEQGKINYFEPSNISPSMQEKVDAEVGKIIDQGYKKAVELVKKHRKALDNVSKALLKRETLDREAFEKIVGKKS